MAEIEKLNIDSIIARLLEGEFVGLFVVSPFESTSRQYLN